MPTARVDIILCIADRNDSRQISLLMNTCCEFFSWPKFLMQRKKPAKRSVHTDHAAILKSLDPGLEYLSKIPLTISAETGHFVRWWFKIIPFTWSAIHYKKVRLSRLSQSGTNVCNHFKTYNKLKQPMNRCKIWSVPF